MMTVIHVAVAVIRNGDGQILLAKRPDHVDQGGLWEFPGGKVESGESVEQALARELDEELGIQAQSCTPLIVIPHRYRDKSVSLDVWEVTGFSGKPVGKEGQPLQWVSQGELASRESETTRYPLPHANFGIVKALRLPPIMSISGEFSDQDVFHRRIQRAIIRGTKIVQCRLPKLESKVRESLLLSAYQQCKGAGALMITNSHFNPGGDYCSDWCGDGIHLSSGQLMNLQTREQVKHGLLGASCHSRAELNQAQCLDLDYVTLSPIRSTTTHPDSSPLGWKKFQQWVNEIKIPVYALGGLGLNDITEARTRGGQGIAAISALWND